MIKFDKLWLVMEQKGVTTYALREKGGIDSKTIRRLRNNENMETKTLDKLCYWRPAEIASKGPARKANCGAKEKAITEFFQILYTEQ